MTKTHLEASDSSNFPPLHIRNPAIVGLFLICLHVFVMSRRRQNNVTMSSTMTDVILQLQLISASAHFPHTFKSVTLLFHITQFFSIGYIGEVSITVCSNRNFRLKSYVFLDLYQTR